MIALLCCAVRAAKGHSDKNGDNPSNDGSNQYYGSSQPSRPGQYNNEPTGYGPNPQYPSRRERRHERHTGRHMRRADRHGYQLDGRTNQAAYSVPQQGQGLGLRPAPMPEQLAQPTTGDGSYGYLNAGPSPDLRRSTDQRPPQEVIPESGLPPYERVEKKGPESQ